MDFYRHDTTRFCTIIGQLGTLKWDAINGNVKLFMKGKKKWKTIYNNIAHKDSTYISEWKHFLDCIKRNKKPKVDGKDGMETLRIIEAIKRSSKSSSKVYLK
jgi:predicted dehydrogenase